MIRPVSRSGDVCEELPLDVSEEFYSEQISAKMYGGPMNRLRELLRNGWAAGMDRSERETRWNHAQAAAIEIWVEGGHALAERGTVLFIKDNGRGFTPEDMSRFCRLGSDSTKPTRNGGANQNCMGRLAGIGLNGRAINMNGRRGTSSEGFYIYTRTAAAGEVTCLKLSAQLMSRGVSGQKTRVDPNNPILSKCRGIHGSFTLIAIPHPVITAEEIIRELPPMLPRRQDRALKISVNGQKIDGLRLPSSMIALGRADLHAEYTKDLEHGGIWLCDEESGFAVMNLTKLGARAYPISRADVTGCFFYPNLLSEMNSDRTGLRPEYWQSDAGKDLLSLLNLTEAREFIDNLVGDRASWQGSSGTQMKALQEKFLDVWGAPQKRAGGGPMLDETRSNSGPDTGFTPPPPKDPKDPTSGGGGGGGGGGGIKKSRRHEFFARIGGKDYLFTRMPNPSEPSYALLSNDRSMLQINTDHALIDRISPSEFMSFALQDILNAVSEDPEQGGGRNPRARLQKRNDLLADALAGSRRRKAT